MRNSCDVIGAYDFMLSKNGCATRHKLSRRTQIKPVAVPNNAVPNRGLISSQFDISHIAVPCGISSNNAQHSPADRSFLWLSHSK